MSMGRTNTVPSSSGVRTGPVGASTDVGPCQGSQPREAYSLRARAEQFRARAEQFEHQAEKAAAAGRTKEADEAKANAEQWRQWAEAAADALTRRP